MCTNLCAILLLSGGRQSSQPLPVERGSSAVVLSMCLFSGTAVLTEVGSLGGGGGGGGGEKGTIKMTEHESLQSLSITELLSVSTSGTKYQVVRYTVLIEGQFKGARYIATTLLTN